jgi:ATP-dependent Clp protease ATP-binding subunit ClpA
MSILFSLFSFDSKATGVCFFNQSSPLLQISILHHSIALYHNFKKKSSFMLLPLLNEENANEYTKAKGFFSEENVDYNIISDFSIKLHEITDTIVNSNINEEVEENETEKTLIKTFVIESEEDLNNFLNGEEGKLIKKTLESKDSSKKNKDKNSIQYCTNLNTLAKEGLINDIVGREKEIFQIVKVLNRKDANNILLIGDTGVGKTAIIEGLAHRIQNGLALSAICDKTILRLNVSEMMGGTQFRGMFEERFANLFKELKKRENIILFIDNFHKFTSERKDDEFNITTLLLPYLQEGNVNVIITTTYDGYRKSLEKNHELLRRCQK